MPIRKLTFDAASGKFGATRAAEEEFARALKKIAQHSASIIDFYVNGSTITSNKGMWDAVRQYSAALEPWAATRSSAMVSRVATSNRKAWETKAKQFGVALRREMLESPTGMVSMDLIREQVSLIKSIPLDAATRAQDLAVEAMLDGSRASEIAEELARTGEVTKSRALTIARTEVARSNSVLTETRARSVGSKGYIWRTSGDGDVRESHAEMEGQYVAWDSPPTLSDGTTTHAGQIYNCRCYAEPVLDDTV